MSTNTNIIPKDFDYLLKILIGSKYVNSIVLDNEITIEEYLIKHNKRYASANEPLKINVSVLRELRLNSLLG